MWEEGASKGDHEEEEAANTHNLEREKVSLKALLFFLSLKASSLSFFSFPCQERTKRGERKKRNQERKFFPGKKEERKKREKKGVLEEEKEKEPGKERGELVAI